MSLLWLVGSPARAEATVRWASPAGSGTECTEATPCSLDIAVESPAVQPGDEVVLVPGSYVVVELDVIKAITVHGQAGQPVPTVTTSSTVGVYIGAAAMLSDLALVASVQSSGIYVAAGGATIERISASVPFAGGTACNVAASVVFRDSLCRATGVNSKGMGSNVSAGPGTRTISLRNVTAVGGFAGIGFDLSGPDAAFEVDASNVIALGGGGPSDVDVRASASNGASVTIALAHSSYATEQEITNGGGVLATVTDPGTGTNQTAPPVFVDAAGGDFHQAAGSPTLDAGVLDAATGTKDIDGDPRAIRATAACPALPDIGADERVTALECDPPETTLEGPTGTIEDSTPTYTVSSDEPGSTFECRVDTAPFATCASPYTTAVLAPGSHTVEARATDLSGNADPTPAASSVIVSAPETTPETTLTKAPKKRVTTSKRKARVSFAFTSATAGTFECSLDGAAFAACTSPVKARLRKGKHVFAVRAVNVSGLVDLTPATVTFKVKLRPRSRWALSQRRSRVARPAHRRVEPKSSAVLALHALELDRLRQGLVVARRVGEREGEDHHGLLLRGQRLQQLLVQLLDLLAGPVEHAAHILLSAGSQAERLARERVAVVARRHPPVMTLLRLALHGEHPVDLDGQRLVGGGDRARHGQTSSCPPTALQRPSPRLPKPRCPAAGAAGWASTRPWSARGSSC